MLQQEKNIVRGTVPTYAVAGDFCRIFTEEMNDLYRLSFLLTADQGKAEQCFLAALEDCMRANQVFREWAHSWARRTIVQNAIRMMQPASVQARHSSVRDSQGRMAISKTGTPFAAVLGLGTFERFAFVLSVLERYSDQDCKLLLECSRQDFVLARSRAMEQIARFSDSLPLPAMRSGGQAFAQAS